MCMCALLPDHYTVTATESKGGFQHPQAFSGHSAADASTLNTCTFMPDVKLVADLPDCAWTW